MVADDGTKLQAVTSVGNVAATDFEAGFFVGLLRGFTQVCYAKMRSRSKEKLPVKELLEKDGKLVLRMEEKL